MHTRKSRFWLDAPTLHDELAKLGWDVRKRRFLLRWPWHCSWQGTPHERQPGRAVPLRVALSDTRPNLHMGGAARNGARARALRGNEPFSRVAFRLALVKKRKQDVMAPKEPTLEVVDYFSAAVLGAVAAVEEAQCPILRGLTVEELRVSYGRASYDGTASEQGTAGVRIQVVSGFVRPEADRIKAVKDRVGMGEWAKLLAKKFSIRPSAADAHIKQAERVQAMDGPSRKGGTERPVMGLLTQGKTAARDDAANSTCSFKILSAGDGKTGWFLLHDLVGKVVDANHLAWRLNKANSDNPKHFAALGCARRCGRTRWLRTSSKRTTPRPVRKRRWLTWCAFRASPTTSGSTATRRFGASTSTPAGQLGRRVARSQGATRPSTRRASTWRRRAMATGATIRSTIGWPRSTASIRWSMKATTRARRTVLRISPRIRSQALYKSLMQKIVRTMPESIELPDFENQGLAVCGHALHGRALPLDSRHRVESGHWQERARRTAASSNARRSS